MANYEAWRAKGCPATEWSRYYWEEDSPPDPERYRERGWTPDEATHYQVYETVSEGTPVTPHFATAEQLVNHLVKHGDFWDQRRGDGGWSRANAERFVSRGSAASLTTTRYADGSVDIKAPRDGA